jgi:hypothetical protein
MFTNDPTLALQLVAAVIGTYAFLWAIEDFIG